MLDPTSPRLRGAQTSIQDRSKDETICKEEADWAQKERGEDD